MPKQIATARMEETRKKVGGSHKRWRDEVGKDSNKMGIKDRRAMVRDHWEWRKTVGYCGP
jgi:hypothetical protein